MRPRRALKRLERALPGRLPRPAPKEPMLAAELVGLTVVDHVGSGDWKGFGRVTAVAEDLLALDDPDVTELIVLGFLEGMHNAASHGDGEIFQRLRSSLPPACAAGWDHVHATLLEVKSWMEATGQSMQRGDDLDAIESEELRRLFRVNYWRAGDGGLIGVADVLDFERDRAERATRGFS